MNAITVWLYIYTVVYKDYIFLQVRQNVPRTPDGQPFLDYPHQHWHIARDVQTQTRLPAEQSHGEPRKKRVRRAIAQPEAIFIYIYICVKSPPTWILLPVV